MTGKPGPRGSIGAPGSQGLQGPAGIPVSGYLPLTAVLIVFQLNKMFYSLLESYLIFADHNKEGYNKKQKYLCVLVFRVLRVLMDQREQQGKKDTR